MDAWIEINARISEDRPTLNTFNTKYPALRHPEHLNTERQNQNWGPSASRSDPNETTKQSNQPA